MTRTDQDCHTPSLHWPLNDVATDVYMTLLRRIARRLRLSWFRKETRRQKRKGSAVNISDHIPSVDKSEPESACSPLPSSSFLRCAETQNLIYTLLYNVDLSLIRENDCWLWSISSNICKSWLVGIRILVRCWIKVSLIRDIDWSSWVELST